jgi:hypothetical protein
MQRFVAPTRLSYKRGSQRGLVRTTQRSEDTVTAIRPDAIDLPPTVPIDIVMEMDSSEQ